jgi:cysteine-rich repeat protein
MPASCGNGFRERDEECDDGNLMSHDGCSSRCRIESPVWTQLSPPTSPPGRAAHSMAYDAERGRIVLFGGLVPPIALGDAWTWDGTTWSPVTSQRLPDPRCWAAMAYDVRRRRIVLFGGAGPIYLADTWLWDGSAWTQAPPAMSPGAWYSSAIAHDSVGQRLVLFGGRDLHGNYLTGTWQWNGTWSIATTVTSPTPTSAQVLVDDPTRGQVVQTGGHGPYDQPTWVFDGVDWSSQSPNVDVDRRTNAAATHDRATGRIVLFGGYGPDYPLNDTWEWNGGSWTRIAVATPPTARDSAGLAYDALHHRAILFGGGNSLGDTWSFRYESAGEPDETCIAGEDADGDGLSGCDDPDCWGYCKPSCPPNAPCDPSAPHCGDGVCNRNLEPRVCPSDCP